MRIELENIILRDMIESDIEDYVRWFTVEREWENWDAPWEKEDTDEDSERRRWTESYESRKDRPDDVRRYRLEIEWNGRHIGSVNAYHIDENYEWIGSLIRILDAKIPRSIYTPGFLLVPLFTFS